MRILGMCIDKKVVAGLAAVGLGIWWFVPGAVGAALPYLILAICPLSMLFMMKAMNQTGGAQAQRAVAPQAEPTAEPTTPGGASSRPSPPAVAVGDAADARPTADRPVVPADLSGN